MTNEEQKKRKRDYYLANKHIWEESYRKRKNNPETLKRYYEVKNRNRINAVREKGSAEYQSYRLSCGRYRKTKRGKFMVYKTGAKKRGIEFLLSFDQFQSFWSKDCSYCGEKIETIGLDRIDSSAGYTVGNIVPCCYLCNRMKNDLSKEDFIKRARLIVFRSLDLDKAKKDFHNDTVEVRI